MLKPGPPNVERQETRKVTDQKKTKTGAEKGENCHVHEHCHEDECHTHEHCHPHEHGHHHDHPEVNQVQGVSNGEKDDPQEASE